MTKGKTPHRISNMPRLSSFRKSLFVLMVSAVCFMVLAFMYYALVVAEDIDKGKLSMSADTRSDWRTSQQVRSAGLSINEYYNKNGTIPKSITEIEELDSRITDRFSSGAYEYKPNPILHKNSANDPTTWYEYSLCTDFLTDRSMYGKYTKSDLYVHQKGRWCFELATFDTFSED